jgi:hypothetical protein
MSQNISAFCHAFCALLQSFHCKGSRTVKLIIELCLAAELHHRVRLMTVSQEDLFLSAVPVINITFLPEIKVVSDVIALHTVSICTLFNTALTAAPLDGMKRTSVNMN